MMHCSLIMEISHKESKWVFCCDFISIRKNVQLASYWIKYLFLFRTLYILIPCLLKNIVFVIPWPNKPSNDKKWKGGEWKSWDTICYLYCVNCWHREKRKETKRKRKKTTSFFSFFPLRVTVLYHDFLHRIVEWKLTHFLRTSIHSLTHRLPSFITYWVLHYFRHWGNSNKQTPSLVLIKLTFQCNHKDNTHTHTHTHTLIWDFVFSSWKVH